MTFNVLDYGAAADGITADSPAVQKAIDACADAGGGTVYFPKGIYVLATVFMKSNVLIRFEEGTDILGSLDFYSYAQQEQIDFPIYQDQSHTYFDLAMFVAKNCHNISITGKARIDMRSVWDHDGSREEPLHGEITSFRGPKCISLKECDNVIISDIEINNATDLAIYFAGCNNVDIHHVKMRVYIDGISPDNCKNVNIYNCDVESGDDGIVFKSSYTLNRLDICKNIRVWNCRVKSQCSAIKFGTETNGGFEDIVIRNIDVYDTRITGIAIESVDGAVIDGVTLSDIRIKNTNGLLFIHLGKRMRGPKELKIGEIKNITLENITAEGPYEPYMCVPTNYTEYKKEIFHHYPWIFSGMENDSEHLKTYGRTMPWQLSSNVCGLKGNPLKNITLRNVHFTVAGGVTDYDTFVPEDPPEYPEIMAYGWTLPAKGIYFRHIDGLLLDNVTVKSYLPDTRDDFVFEDVKSNNISQ